MTLTLPLGELANWFPGQVSVGICVSLTVTVKEQICAGGPGAVQVTVVVPFGKNAPEAGEQLTVPQLPTVDGAA